MSEWMNRVFLTGDKHRNFDSVEDFCSKMQTYKGDMMIVLGDNGVNWFDDARDDQYKTFLSQIPIGSNKNGVANKRDPIFYSTRY